MSVHSHSRFAIGYVQHHIGCFAAHSGQGLQCFARAGHLTAVLFNEYLACFQEVAGFVSVQTNGLDVVLEAILPQCQNGSGCVGHWKKFSGGFVHAHIGGLRRQQHSREEFKHRGIGQLGGGRGVGLLQGLKKEFDVVSVHERKYQQNGEIADSIEVRIDFKHQLSFVEDTPCPCNLPIV